MNGLISKTPSQSAIRVALAGFLILVAQNLILLLGSDPGTIPRSLIWVLTSLAVTALLAALIGIPEPSTEHWRRRLDR